MSPNDSDDNEFDQLIALRSSDIMHNLLDKYQILNKYDDQKSYSESASSDIRSKYMRLENFNFEEGRLSDLVDMAVEKYGFITTRFRRRAWRKLLANQEAQSEKQNFKTITQEQIKSNRYFNQVTLDVARTLKRFPPEINESLREKLQEELIDLICKILIRNEKLHYYQGYHDICLTFVLVSGVEESLSLIENLTLTHLTPFMEANMESTLKLLLNIMPLINELNSSVAEHLQKAELGVIFSLSWLITWYSHVTDNIQIILRLYDFFIASDPLMPVYFGAIIVDDKSDEVLSIECDMASLHTIISKYPSKIEDIEILEKYIEKAVSLFKKYPPSYLNSLNQKWHDRCKQIQEEKLQVELEYRMNLKKRKLHKTPRKTFSLFNNKKHDENSDDESSSHVVSKRNHSLMISASKPKLFANRFIVGLTLTVGVAAIATMYAINGSKDPQEILSKVVQFIS